MNLKVKQKELSLAIKTVLGIVSNRATLPVLGNILLVAEDGKLTVEATNLDSALSCSIECQSKETGKVTLPAKKFGKIVDNIAADDISIKVDNTFKAVVKGGTSKYTIMGIDAEEFPPIPQLSDANSFTLAQEQLGAMLKNVAFAQSQDETRYILNGVYFEMEEGVLSLVATDGRRLAKSSETVEFPFNDPQKVIVPQKTISELRKLLGKQGDVNVSFSDRQINFSVDAPENKGFTDKIRLFSKVVEGNYPNYQQVIPKEKNIVVELDRNEFAAAVKRVSLVTTDKSNTVKFSFGKDSGLTLTCSSADFGEAEEKLDVDFDKEDVAIAFNPKFILDVLNAVDDEKINFSLKNDISPGVFFVGENFKAVVMPLRLS